MLQASNVTVLKRYQELTLKNFISVQYLQFFKIIIKSDNQINLKYYFCL